MNLDQLYAALRENLETLDNAGIADDRRLDLEILTMGLKQQIVAGSFDTLRQLDTVTMCDVTELHVLSRQVAAEVGNQQKRNAAIDTLITIATAALRAAGVPIPVLL